MTQHPFAFQQHKRFSISLVPSVGLESVPDVCGFADNMRDPMGWKVSPYDDNGARGKYLHRHDNTNTGENELLAVNSHLSYR